MRRYAFLIICVSSLSGCNTIKRGLNDNKGSTSVLPSDQIVTGITTADYQIIQPVRVLDSVVTVRVLVPGTTEWRTCNQYEYALDAIGAGGGAIEFGHRVMNYGQTLVVLQKPVAPIGTQYEIRSIQYGHALY